jgi:hypothetical protein
MSIERIARRRFLLGLGGVTLALPWLPSIMSTAKAAPNGKPNRFIFMFTSCGQRPENWYPEQDPAWTTLGTQAREAAWGSTSGISPILGPEFDALKPKLSLIRGLDFINQGDGGHVVHSSLSGHLLEGNVTVDQILAQSTEMYPTPPPVRSVHMLIKQEYQSPTSCSIANTGGQLEEIQHETSLQASYNRLFGTYEEPTNDPKVEQRRAAKLGLLDRVRGEYELLRDSPRLSSDDKERLTAHAELLHDLTARLGAASGVGCQKPAEPPELDAGVDANLPEITKINLDLLVAAIKCDRTRVATVMLCPGTDLRDFSYLPGGPLGEHHALSHNGVGSQSASDNLRTINNWYAQQVAYFMSELDKDIEDTQNGNTYLDNSLVFWGNEDGCNGFDAHVPKAMPVLLGGSLGGVIKTGRYLDYRALGEKILYNAGGSPADLPTDFRGLLYNSFLISILQAYGLTPAEYEQNGQPGFGTYDNNYQSQYSVSAGQQPLPHFLA